ncbi:MAG: phosphatidylglycerol lysyltransferase [Treponema sp.]|nr:phosphatidylglycerol lysyltransferase [Treponema sp.]
MTIEFDIEETLERLILSASGWRGVFALNGDEESVLEQISASHRIIAGAAAFIFSQYLKKNTGDTENKPSILIGNDTRPTGKAIIEAMIPVLLSEGCNVFYTGVVAAPEIMAWARFFNEKNKNGLNKTGFIYVSASHNPIGHNGLKFGLTDGGVLAADEAVKLIADFRKLMENGDFAAKFESLLTSAEPNRIKNIYDNENEAKKQAYKAYFDFCGNVVSGGCSNLEQVMKEGLEKKPLGIVCDFNGSARTVSIDKEFFDSLGFKFKYINDKPGQIVHRIVPEGESLDPCARLLEEIHKKDSSFVLGYVPDCDGDRGNLVIYDTKINKTRSLEAQEVFALACVAELSHLVWTGEISYNDKNEALCKAAVAINDPTSMRIDRIADAFSVSVFRAEVGEANVVSLARMLREGLYDNNKYIVRILGEGSAGGNITHPSAVRDPINTVLAIAKMLSVRSNSEFSAGYKPGLFEIWCKFSGQTEKYHEDFSLADIIDSLPPFLSTPAYSPDAIMSVKTQDHALLKDKYQQIFIKEWEERKEELKKRFDICNWEAIAYNGTIEKRGLNRFGDAGKGGLKILFFDRDNREIAYIWMRGSATEPVFRIMADVKTAHTPTEGRSVKAAGAGMDVQTEKYLLEWQRSMIIKADI